MPRSCRSKAGNGGRKAGARSCRAPHSQLYHHWQFCTCHSPPNRIHPMKICPTVHGLGIIPITLRSFGANSARNWIIILTLVGRSEVSLRTGNPLEGVTPTLLFLSSLHLPNCQSPRNILISFTNCLDNNLPLRQLMLLVRVVMWNNVIFHLLYRLRWICLIHG